MLPRLRIAASILALLPLCLAAHAAQTVLTHHVPVAMRNSSAQPLGRLPGTQLIALDVVLPLRDSAALDTFLTQLYDPTNPIYKHYLTPQQFAEKFGPTQSNYDTLVAFLKSNGFTVTGGTFLGREVQVKAPVSVIEAAFHVAMNVYQHPTESRTFYSPDREPTVNLPFPLWHISGLDNFSIPKPRLVSRDDYAKAHNIKPEDVVTHATTGSGPSASFLGSDMRAAYYGGTALTGAGQNLGLFEYLGTDLADLTTYFTNVGQTNNVPITLLSTDGTSTACLDTTAGGKCDDGEQTLDMTQAIGMAPGLSSLVMYIGSLDTAIISSMTTHSPLPTVIGCSWGWTPADATTLDPYFKQMATQGQNFFVASGDDSTWTKTGNAESWPADDAYIVAVGGTDLVTASAAGPWASETAWVDSGGGISPNAVAIPSWQTATGIITTTNKGSSTLRNGPDVSANANFTFYTCGDQKACQSNYYGGTSFAAPMWAGYIALVNQQLAINSKPTIGFLNPFLYAENITPATYATDFHDITSGTSGSYSSTTGYDLVTGWGSPTPSLITTLVTTPGGTPDFSLSPASSTLTSITGALTDVITVSSLSGFVGSVALTCSGAGGITCSLSPTSTTLTSGGTGTSTLSITTTGVTTAGTYNVVVTGVGTSGTHTVTIAVTSAVTDFSLSAASTAITATNNPTLTDVLTATSVNGFAGSVAFTCSAAGALTCSLTPTPGTLTAGGTATSTLSVVTSAVTTGGTFNVVVTGTGPAGTHTVTVAVTAPANTLTIVPANAITIPTQGATGTTNFTLTPAGTLSGAVTLTCAVTTTPAGATYVPTCSVTNPITVTLNTPSTGVLTINTTAQQSTVSIKQASLLAAGLLAALLILPIRRRRLPTLLALFITAMLLGTAIGCGGNSSSNSGGSNAPTGGTTLGGYVVSITATAGTITNTTPVNLTVN